MSDPIGVENQEVLNDSIQVVIDTWKTEEITKQKWSKVKGAWITAINYVVSAGDYFIQQVDVLMVSEKGEDKKATVLAALSKVYDNIVSPFLPIWLRPFNSRIKDFVIYVLASIMVDFFVSKYRNGSWSSETKNFSGPIFTKIITSK